MVTLEFFDPCGRLEAKHPHARRLDSLAGKRVGFVSNEQWQAYRMLPLLKSLLERDFTGIEVLPIDALPQGNALIGNEAFRMLEEGVASARDIDKALKL